MLTVYVVSLNKAPASFAHHYSIRVSMTDEVISKDWISPTSDICTSPLIFPNHIVFIQQAKKEIEIGQVGLKGHKYTIPDFKKQVTIPVIRPLPFSFTAMPAACPWKIWFPLCHKYKLHYYCHQDIHTTH